MFLRRVAKRLFASSPSELSKPTPTAHVQVAVKARKMRSTVAYDDFAGWTPKQMRNTLKTARLNARFYKLVFEWSDDDLVIAMGHAKEALEYADISINETFRPIRLERDTGLPTPAARKRLDAEQRLMTTTSFCRLPHEFDGSIPPSWFEPEMLFDNRCDTVQYDYPTIAQKFLQFTRDAQRLEARKIVADLGEEQASEELPKEKKAREKDWEGEFVESASVPRDSTQVLIVAEDSRKRKRHASVVKSEGPLATPNPMPVSTASQQISEEGSRKRRRRAPDVEGERPLTTPNPMPSTMLVPIASQQALEVSEVPSTDSTLLTQRQSAFSAPSASEQVQHQIPKPPLQEFEVHVGWITSANGQRVLQKDFLALRTWIESVSPWRYDYQKMRESLRLTSDAALQVFWFDDYANDPWVAKDEGALAGAIERMYKKGEICFFVATNVEQVRAVPMFQRMIWQQKMQTVKLQPFIDVGSSQQIANIKLETPPSLQSESLRLTPSVSLEKVVGDWVMRSKISHKPYENY